MIYGKCDTSLHDQGLQRNDVATRFRFNHSTLKKGKKKQGKTNFENFSYVISQVTGLHQHHTFNSSAKRKKNRHKKLPNFFFPMKEANDASMGKSNGKRKTKGKKNPRIIQVLFSRSSQIKTKKKKEKKDCQLDSEDSDRSDCTTGLKITRNLSKPVFCCCFVHGDNNESRILDQFRRLARQSYKALINFIKGGQ